MSVGGRGVDQRQTDTQTQTTYRYLNVGVSLPQLLTQSLGESGDHMLGGGVSSNIWIRTDPMAAQTVKENGKY